MSTLRGYAAAEAEVWGVSGSTLLVVKRGPNAGSQFLLDQPVTSIGRNPDCDIYLDDVTVSRRHAEFRRQSPEVHIVDLGSLNGTYVNNQPVQSALLAHGDEIAIGNYRLVWDQRQDGGMASLRETEQNSRKLAGNGESLSNRGQSGGESSTPRLRSVRARNLAPALVGWFGV